MGRIHRPESLWAPSDTSRAHQPSFSLLERRIRSFFCGVGPAMKLKKVARPEQLDRIRELLPEAHKDRQPFTKRHVPALISLLRDRYSCNRGDALVALSKLRARAAVPAMIRCLRDPSWVVR